MKYLILFLFLPLLSNAQIKIEQHLNTTTLEIPNFSYKLPDKHFTYHQLSDTMVSPSQRCYDNNYAEWEYENLDAMKAQYDSLHAHMYDVVSPFPMTMYFESKLWVQYKIECHQDTARCPVILNDPYDVDYADNLKLEIITKRRKPNSEQFMQWKLFKLLEIKQ